MKGFWIWMLLFFKLNYTLPLDVAMKTSTNEKISDGGKSSKTFHRIKTKVDDTNLMDFKKVTEEIKEAVSRLEQLRNSEKYSAAEVLYKGKVDESSLTENVEDENTPQRGYHSDHQQGSLKDLKDYEKFVITKKYPYAEIDDLKSKQTLLNSNAVELKLRSSSPFTVAEQSICESPDDALNIEIISRGLTGFEIPILKQKTEMKPVPEVNDIKLTDKIKEKMKETDGNFVDRLKELIMEFEAKKKRRNMSPLVK